MTRASILSVYMGVEMVIKLLLSFQAIPVLIINNMTRSIIFMRTADICLLLLLI